MQRAEPERVKPVSGHVLPYRLTCGELERLQLEASRNTWLRILASQLFYELPAGSAQFLKDFIRAAFHIDGTPRLGLTEDQISLLDQLSPVVKEDQLTRIVSDKLQINETLARAVIKAAAQNIAGFIQGVVLTGIDSTNDITIIPFEKPDEESRGKYINLFVNPIDKTIYFVSITHNVLLNIGGTDVRTLPGNSIVLYRLEKNNQQHQFKFVSAEFENIYLYRMARGERVSARELYEAYFPVTEAKQPGVNYLKLMQLVQDDLRVAAQKDPIKVDELKARCQQYLKHLRSRIISSIGSIPFVPLVAPNFGDTNTQVTTYTILPIEDIANQLRENSYRGNFQIDEDCKEAILKYQIVSGLIKILENINHKHLSQVLDDFSIYFQEYKGELEKIRDSKPMQTGWVKSASSYVGIWKPKGMNFVKDVLVILEKPVSPRLDPVLSPSTFRKI